MLPSLNSVGPRPPPTCRRIRLKTIKRTTKATNKKIDPVMLRNRARISPLRVIPNHFQCFFRIYRSAKEVTLPESALQVAQIFRLLGGLDALGHHFDAQTTAETD